MSEKHRPLTQERGGIVRKAGFDIGFTHRETMSIRERRREPRETPLQ